TPPHHTSFISDKSRVKSETIQAAIQWRFYLLSCGDITVELTGRGDTCKCGRTKLVERHAPRAPVQRFVRAPVDSNALLAFR
ncbi:MAG: hypothetical protein QOH71_4334, partial [Blastocatellia bacterium]|nr:hypothetical protein [Blastocatellia bacterium]